MVSLYSDIESLYLKPIQRLHEHAYYEQGILRATNKMLPNPTTRAFKHRSLIHTARVYGKMLLSNQTNPMDDETAMVRSTLSLYGVLSGMIVVDKVNEGIIASELAVTRGVDLLIGMRMSDARDYPQVQRHLALIGMRGVSSLGISAKKISVWDHEASQQANDPNEVEGVFSRGFGLAVLAAHTARRELQGINNIVQK